MISSGLRSATQLGQSGAKEAARNTRRRPCAHGERHTARDILLVGKDQKQRVLHFAIVDNLVQLRPGLLEAGGITRVHNEDETLCTGVVVSPERADLVLTADIPHIEFDVLIGHALDVESDGGDRGHVLVAEFQFVKNSWR